MSEQVYGRPTVHALLFGVSAGTCLASSFVGFEPARLRVLKVGGVKRIGQDIARHDGTAVSTSFRHRS
eukprot:8705588-Alexandrium_andersonii.AAC.1